MTAMPHRFRKKHILLCITMFMLFFILCSCSIFSVPDLQTNLKYEKRVENGEIISYENVTDQTIIDPPNGTQGNEKVTVYKVEYPVD